MELVGRLLDKLRFSQQTSTVDSTPQESSSQSYGAFFGVYLPSALAIFSMIMYLRLGTIIGRVGIMPTLSIIGISSLITLLAALSISSIATNMKIHKGGAYYIISRSLGIDFGAAIGIPLYFAQAIGIAFCLLGFSETIHALIPTTDPKIISLITLAVLGFLSFFSTKLVLKTHLVIFIAIMASLASLFLGNKMIDVSTLPAISSRMGFWTAFALFFPAVTGIEAGISLSGVLKNPSRALPIGTIASVLSGLVIYIGVALFLWTRVPNTVLAQNPFVCQEIARWSFLILVGIWGATLSSALAALLGAPRTLQALAEDKIVFSFLSKEQGKNREPRHATLITMLLASLFILFGNIDLIAPVLTMFFLISYGILNLVCGLETLMDNPSWRPTFKIPASVSFSGTLFCFLAMLMINAGATIVSLFFVTLIYFFRGRKLSSNWDDICFGILMLFTKKIVYSLKSAGFAARNWRPHLLIFSPSVTPPPSLMEFSSRLTKGNSFLTIANILEPNSPYSEGTVEKAINKSLKRHNMHAFVDVNKVDHLNDAYKGFIITHGIGPLTHNTVVLTYSQNGCEYELFPEMIQHSYEAGKNIIILKVDDPVKVATKEIDLWWDSANKKTSELILVLAHMYQSKIKRSSITIKSIIHCETAREQRLNYFKNLFAKSRLNISYKIYVAPEEDEFKIMNHFSEASNLTFIGLPNPTKGQSLGEYRGIYNHYMKNLKHLKQSAFIVAAEPVNFQEIFR